MEYEYPKATTSLLRMIKSGFQVDNQLGSYVRRSAYQKTTIKAYCKYDHQEERFPLTRQGLEDAMKFAFGNHALR